MSGPGIEGFLDPRFAAAGDLLAEHLERGLDAGFGFSVYVGGAPAVDLWGGVARSGSGEAWRADSLSPLTSIGKTLLTFLLLRLVARREVDLDAPVSSYWPEFGQGGKHGITIAEVASHRAGIPAFSSPITLVEEIARRPVVERIERMRPIWTPGSAHGYHAVVLAYLLAELVERVAGEPAPAQLQREAIDPLHLDLKMGLDPADLDRLVEVVPPAEDAEPEGLPVELRDYAAAIGNPDSLLLRATFGSTAMTFADTTDPAYCTAARPAAYATATATARFFAALVSEVDGLRLLEPETVELARGVQAEGPDLVFELPTRWGAGFMLPGGPLWPEFGRDAFGHIGSTGALAFADPEAELSFAFLPNKIKSVYEVPDRRAQALVAAVYAALGMAVPAAASARTGRGSDAL